MELNDRRYSALIVSCYPKYNSALLEILYEQDIHSVDVVESVSAAKRRLSEYDYDIVLIRAPLRDESGIGFSLDLVRKKSSAAAIFVPNDRYAETADRVTMGGVYTVPLSASKQVVEYSLMWLKAARERLRLMEERTVSIEVRMKQIRRVNHAKWLLMSHGGMTEDGAHHYIERQAMDSGMTKAAVAEKIIDRYED